MTVICWDIVLIWSQIRTPEKAMKSRITSVDSQTSGLTIACVAAGHVKILGYSPEYTGGVVCLRRRLV